MRITKVSYSIRKSLGQYEHEEMTAEVCPELDEDVSGEELMKEARAVCVSNLTVNLIKKAKEAKEKAEKELAEKIAKEVKASEAVLKQDKNKENKNG